MQIGDQKKLIPAHRRMTSSSKGVDEESVVAVVTEVHWKHRWYQVEYKLGNTLVREGIKF